MRRRQSNRLGKCTAGARTKPSCETSGIHPTRYEHSRSVHQTLMLKRRKSNRLGKGAQPERAPSLEHVETPEIQPRANGIIHDCSSIDCSVAAQSQPSHKEPSLWWRLPLRRSSRGRAPARSNATRRYTGIDRKHCGTGARTGMMNRRHGGACRFAGATAEERPRGATSLDTARASTASVAAPEPAGTRNRLQSGACRLVETAAEKHLRGPMAPFTAVRALTAALRHRASTGTKSRRYGGACRLAGAVAEERLHGAMPLATTRASTASVAAPEPAIGMKSRLQGGAWRLAERAAEDQLREPTAAFTMVRASTEASRHQGQPGHEAVAMVAPAASLEQSRKSACTERRHRSHLPEPLSQALRPRSEHRHEEPSGRRRLPLRRSSRARAPAGTERRHRSRSCSCINRQRCGPGASTGMRSRRPGGACRLAGAVAEGRLHGATSLTAAQASTAREGAPVRPTPHAHRHDGCVVSPEGVQAQDAPDVDEVQRRAQRARAEDGSAAEAELEQVDGHEGERHQARPGQVQTASSASFHNGSRPHVQSLD